MKKGVHPEDYRLPLIICPDTVPVKQIQNMPYSVVDLKGIIESLLKGPSRQAGHQ